MRCKGAEFRRSCSTARAIIRVSPISLCKVKLLKVASWEAIKRDRFSVTPSAIYDELVAPPQTKNIFDSFRPFINVLLSPSAANPALVKVRNAQKLQSLWNEDATRRQARMSSPLDEDEEVVQTQGSDEQVGVAENAAETVPRLCRVVRGSAASCGSAG